MADQRHAAGIAERYATAILELAQEERAVDTVERDLTALGSMLSSSAELGRFVRSPIFSRTDHAKGMKALLAKAGASALTTRFVQTLAAKRRLFLLAEVIKAFRKELARIRGEVDAEVIAARPLSDDQLNELKATIRSKIGREPRLESRIDPSLLGGLVVKVGSRMIDSSLRSKLDGIRHAMRGTRNS